MSRVLPPTDFGVVSLLLQVEFGLEIEYREHPNDIIPVPPKSNEIIANVSETLQKWTNNVMKAGMHRVTVPNGTKDEGKTVLKESFSMAYFFEAEWGASVGPSQRFVEPQRPPRYQDMTALEFQRWKIQKIYQI